LTAVGQYRAEEKAQQGGDQDGPENQGHTVGHRRLEGLADLLRKTGLKFGTQEIFDLELQLVQ
jgi:hypothetical protein